MKDIRKKEKVGTVLVSNVNEETLKAKILALGIDTNKDVLDLLTPKELLTMFTEWSTEQIKDFASRDEDYAQCEHCDAPCHPSWNACPVCGTGDTEFAEEVIEVTGELVEPEPDNPRAIMKVSDLDDAVSRIKKLQQETMKSYYWLGKELAAVHTSKIYKLRVDSEGNPMYNSWNEFCEAEIGLSGSRCMSIANVSNSYTEEQVESIGVEKLRIIMRADPADRPKLLNDAPLKTTKELQKVVIPGNRPTEGTLGKKLKMNEERLGTEAAKAVRIQKQLQETGKEITTVIQMVTHDVPLIPRDGNGFKGEETLVNDVRVKYEILTEGKKRLLRISYRRPVEDEGPVV